jgi:hypothetical protein
MINRTKMPRQLRNKGGITSVSSRKKYGIGSDIKDFVRDIIPNELADVAVKVAPIVAPFYPGYAAIARGLGRFDQRGSISDALKQGAATYVGGRGVRALAGAEGAAGGFDTFSKKGFQERGLGRLFQKKQGVLTEDQMKRKRLSDLKNADSIKDTPEFMKTATDATIGKVPLLNKLPDMVQQKLLVGGITSGVSALYSYFTGEFEPQKPGETTGEYMARRNTRVKEQMRGYMDSYYTPLRNPQYAAMSDEEKNNFIDSIVGEQNDAMMATGGRVGYQTGGISSANTLAENIARNRAAQSAFQQSINPSQQRVVERLQKMNPAGTGNIIQGVKDFGDHARVSEAMAGKINMPVIPEYGMQTGYDFQTKMAGLDPRISSALAKGYQYAQEGARAVLDGPGGVTLGQAMETAKKQSDQNIEGIMSAASEQGLTAKQQADRNKYLASQGQPTETTPTPDTEIPGFSRVMANDALQPPGSYNYIDNRGNIYTEKEYADLKNKKQEFPMPTNAIPNYEGGSMIAPNLYLGPTGIYEELFEGNFRSMGRTDPRTQGLMASGGRVGLMGGAMPMGIMRSNKAGVMERDYRDEGGFVPVGIKEKADDVPAMLSKNEFVFTADAVRGAGNGSIEKGAQKMYDTMKNLERRVV